MNDAKEHLRYLSLVTYLLVSSEKTIAYFSLANDTIQYSSIDDFWEEMQVGLNIEKYEFLKVGSINSFLAILIGLSSRLLCEARAHSGLCNRVTSSKMPTRLQKR